MFLAFNLEELKDFSELRDISDAAANKNYDTECSKIRERLNIDNLLSEAVIIKKSNEVSIDADKVQKSIFPTIKGYNVFLSHSHKDIKLVKKFAYFLKKLGINAFIDSAVWGYADDLLLAVDNKYAKKSEGNYDYTIRNLDTTNINLMLSNALQDMIDETECVFFINTPNSIDIKSNIETEQTSSPWIYDELKTVSIIKRRIPTRFKEYYNQFEAGKIQMFKPTIPNWIRNVDDELADLYKLKNKNLHNWKLLVKSLNKDLEAEEVLDCLYKILPKM